MKNNTEYHPLAKFLHWSIVAIVLAQFVTDDLMGVHMSIGMLVLPAAALLLLVRFIRPVTKDANETPGLMGVAAGTMKYALYLLLVIVPLSGWAFVSAFGVKLQMLGLFDLPMIVERGSRLGYYFGDAHSFLSNAIGLLVFGHIAAALYHQHVLKDQVLRRMLPRRVTQEVK